MNCHASPPSPVSPATLPPRPTRNRHPLIYRPIAPPVCSRWRRRAHWHCCRRLPHLAGHRLHGWCVSSGSVGDSCVVQRIPYSRALRVAELRSRSTYTRVNIPRTSRRAEPAGAFFTVDSRGATDGPTACHHPAPTPPPTTTHPRPRPYHVPSTTAAATGRGTPTETPTHLPLPIDRHGATLPTRTPAPSATRTTRTERAYT